MLEVGTTIEPSMRCWLCSHHSILHGTPLVFGNFAEFRDSLSPSPTRGEGGGGLPDVPFRHKVRDKRRPVERTPTHPLWQ